MNSCPRCKGCKIASYKHMSSKVWCTNCDFVLKDEGSDKYNGYDKPQQQRVEMSVLRDGSDYHVELMWTKPDRTGAVHFVSDVDVSFRDIVNTVLK